MYKLSGEILQELLNYLATRPYKEVHKFIPVIQNAEEIKVRKKVVKK